MNYEKKYKEIVGQLKKAYLYAQTDSTKAVLEEIFPELKESEDERIRRQTLKVLNYYKDEEKSEGRMPTEIDECIAWLGKQGEQKSQRMISAEAKEAMYGKPAWSEEDEEELFNAVYACLNFYGKDSDTTDWLKSLKQRIGG